MAFELSSPAFDGGQPIPHRHARRGENLSPFLQWSDPPANTQSYVLVMEDPDAPSGTFRHWAVYDIPADHRHIPEGRSSKAGTEALPHGFNDFGNPRYDGPDPPAGDRPHTYRFRLAALDVPSLELDDNPDARKVWEAAREHILGETDLTGTYKPG
jgi:Raf kinase inhibitor-like YbhB/YbcL family protein